MNQSRENFKGLSPLKAPLRQFYNANATLPTLFIESGVTLGRAWEGNKRGGKLEATDRLIEQGTSAITWIYGIKILKKAGEAIGKNLLKINSFDFDIGFDELRNPVKNNKIDAKRLGFKTGNILVSTAMATYFIGFVLPKINNYILKKSLEKQKADKKTTTDSKNFKSFEEFKNKTTKQPSFTSIKNQTSYFAHLLENNSVVRLLTTDTGVICGRYKNGKNKFRKIEGLFRDISSIYFYLFSVPHVVKLLNKLEKNTDINPDALEKTVQMINFELEKNPKSAKNFLENMLGNKKQNEKIDEIFKDKKVIDVEEFIKLFPEKKQKALEMAKLQPIFEGNGVLSKKQAQDVLNYGAASNPRFLKKTLNAATKGASDNKTKFVSRKNLEKIRDSIDEFIKQIDSCANKKQVEITKGFVEKIANKNIQKNFLNNSIATLISILALGILIPKVQYFIGKKLSNEDKFHFEEK